MRISNAARVNRVGLSSAPIGRTAVLALMMVAVTACQGATTRTPSPTAQDYRYTKTEDAELLGGSGRYSVLVPETREVWIATDGSGRIRTVKRGAVYFGANDRAQWQGQETSKTEDQSYGPGKLSYKDLSRTPTDPSALKAAIIASMTTSAGGQPSIPFEVWLAARDYLWETVAPLKLSQGILEMLKTTSGVTVDAGQNDRTGRPAVACSVLAPGGTIRNVLLLEPETGALLGEQQILVKPATGIDAAPPVTIKYATYLESRIVPTTSGA